MRLQKEKLFFISLLPFPIVSIGLLAITATMVVTESLPALPSALQLIVSNVWNPELEMYGLLAPLLGSIIASSISMLVSLIFGVQLTLAVAELLRGRTGAVLQTFIELASAIPTVVYGLWAAQYLAPAMMEYIMKPLHEYLGFLPLFSCRPLGGYSLLTAGIAIGVSTLPYATSIMVEAYRMIPETYREACLGIGATRYETAKILLSMAKPAVFGASLLSLARALGETTIAAMTVGNVMNVSFCLFVPSYTIPALIAAQFGNAYMYQLAAPVLYLSALIVLALALGLSLLGTLMLRRWRVRILG